MQFFGDFALGKTFDVKFTTAAAATGLPTTLAGSPVVSAYPDNSTTELTAGITLSVDFDSRTGMHNVRVVATSGNGYATATNYALVLTAGTVGGTSVVGYVIGHFSIEARSAIRPTTADRTLDVSATGEAGMDWGNVGSPSTSVSLSATTVATVTTATTATNLTNAPTNGDLTATMKTSVQTAATAATPTIAALGSQAKTDVNAEVVDVLGVDTLSEMGAGAPPLAPTTREVMNYLYRWAIRNKKTVDASASPAVETVLADNGSTPLFKRDISDSANVTTFAETVSG